MTVPKVSLEGFQAWLKSAHGKQECRRIIAEKKAAEKQAAEKKPESKK